MGDDIVERLRHMEPRNIGELRLDAADAIEELTAEREASRLIISDLRAEVERLRAEHDAIDALHQPIGKPAACCTCWKAWPCRTHLLLHPEEVRRG